MEQVNLFEQATRQKLRFESEKGQLTVEHLWDMPLLAKHGTFDLDNLAKAVKRELDAASTESFVQAASPASELLTLKLELLKSIIGTKLAERDAAHKAAERRAERKRLTELLADKQDDELKGLSADEIRERIAALGDE